MATKYWLKLYHEMLDDPKVARLNDSAYRRFIECLLMAGELDKNGLLPPLEDMAWRIRVSETALTQDLARLALGGMVELQQYEDGERWYVSKFAERQTPMDKAEYMRRKREAERKDGYYQDSYPQRYQPVTNGNTDIDIDIDIDKDIYSAHAENETPQNISDALTAIANVCKGKLNTLAPSDDFERLAYELADDADSIPGFTAWWKVNGYYPGKPALKSFRDEWDNYREGVDMTPARKDTGPSDGFDTQAPGYHVAGSI